MNDCAQLARARVLACAVVLLVTAGAAVQAQDADPRTTARVRLGPLYISPTLELRDIGVDTNVYNESIQEPIRDFAFTVVPAFTATIGPRRANLSLRSSSYLVYFAKQRSERSVNEDLTASARVSFGRLSPFAEAGYLNTRERISGEIDARARRVERRGAAGVGVALTPKLSVELRGDVWRMAFDGDEVFNDFGLAEELNRESRTLGGTVRYGATPLTAIVLSTEVSETQFLQSVARDTDTRQTLVGVEFNPRALIAGSARIGYQHFRPRSAEIPDFSGIVGVVNVSYRLPTSTTIGFTFDRRTDFSYLSDEPYYLREGYGLSIRRQLVPRWYVEVGGTRASHRYRRVNFVPGDPVTGHSERLLGATVTVGYDLGSRTRMTTGLSYQHRRSDFTARRFNGLRLGTSIVFGF